MYEVDLHRLAVFYTVVREGTLSKAGKRLFMSQPAISAHIKVLEQQLGLSLFDRIGRRSVVNKAGEVLYKKAEELFSVAEDLKAEMQDLKGVAVGRLKLGASVTWQYHLSGALDQFKQEYPGVEVFMESANSDRVEKLVLDRTLDIGFIGRASSSPDTTSIYLTDDELVPSCNVSHRFVGLANIGVSELTDEDFIVREPGSATRKLIDEFLKAQNMQDKISMELGSYEAIKRAVMVSNGIGMVSKRALDAELRAGLLAIADIPELKASIALHLIHLQHKKITATQRVFIDMITSSWAPSGSMA